jgi:rhamnogalacturonan endolyase
MALLSSAAAVAQPVMENLSRGVIAVRTGETTAYVGWRLLATDPTDVAFNLYRASGTGYRYGST